MGNQVGSILGRAEDGIPPAKMPRLEGKNYLMLGLNFVYNLLLLSVVGTQLEADLERAQKEIEQLKTDHDVAIERKDREVSKAKPTDRRTQRLINFLLCVLGSSTQNSS